MDVTETKLIEAISILCQSVEGKPVGKNRQVLSGWAEVQVNGIQYQAQVVLEPRQTHYTDENIVSVRDVEDEDLLKIDVKF